MSEENLEDINEKMLKEIEKSGKEYFKNIEWEEVKDDENV